VLEDLNGRAGTEDRLDALRPSLNGAVIRVPNGKRLVADLVSHHYIITTGHNLNELEMVSKVFDIECVTD